MRRIGIAVFVVGLLGGDARAQQGANIDLQAFRPAMDSRGYITVNASQVLGHKEVSFGLVTNWGRNLLRFEDGATTYEVENILTPTLVGALGLRLGKAELELGISAPFAIMSGDRGPDSDGGTPDDPNDDQTFSFEGQGLGDLGVHAKLRLLNTSRGARIGVALVGSAYLPTATQTEAWLGDGQTSGQLGVVVDRELGPVRVAANAGFRYRTETRFEDLMTGVPMTGQSISVGSGLPFGAGLAYALSRQKFDVVAEIIGEVPLVGHGYLPLEALAGIKVYLARNSFLMLGGGAGLMPSRGGNPEVRAFLGIVFEPSVGDRDGDGIKDDVDMCPDDPEDFDDFEDEDGCPDPDNDQDGILDEDDQCPNEPEDKDGFEDEDGCPEGNEFDRDGDGILDEDDQCPDDPEDLDGFEDEDGCPDPDNDGDGILDIDDLCPDDPEDFDGFEDGDGCPDPDNDRDRILDEDDQCPGVDGQPREETAETWNNFEDDDGCPDRGTTYFDDGKLVALENIYFEYNSARIKPISYGILDAIATTMELNPDITRIEVQGHTDERGSDSYNLRLSQARAESVVAYLVGKRIPAARLQAQGYGERVPLDRRSNQEAWAKNRRVEFLILKRAGEQ
ncbi:MAG TPA: OmpA family protein [Kofleriaceae bacterium]|nr:OmpA family protein [Kofleriaceae bacterium]